MCCPLSAVGATLWALDSPRFSGGFGCCVVAGTALADSEGQPCGLQQPSSQSRAGTLASPAGRSVWALGTRDSSDAPSTPNSSPPQAFSSGTLPHSGSCGHPVSVVCCLGKTDRQRSQGPTPHRIHGPQLPVVCSHPKPAFFFFKLPRAFRELCVFEFRGGGCTLTRLPSCRVRKS